MLSSVIQCADFLQFQDALKKMREIDDKIIYALNTTIPTESFRGQMDATTKCKDLYGQLKEGHVSRENVIKHCITLSADKVKQLKERRDADKDNIDLMKNLRDEQTKLRLLQVELNVEEIVKQRSSKVFQERCRSYYFPEQSL